MLMCASYARKLFNVISPSLAALTAARELEVLNFCFSSPRSKLRISLEPLHVSKLSGLGRIGQRASGRMRRRPAPRPGARAAAG
jgi:hypothetical protein